MFQGITKQIAEAQKEINRQEFLKKRIEQIEKHYKEDLKRYKKTNTALSKFSFPDVDLNKTEQQPSLTSLFFAVFGKQENEGDSKRRSFIEHILLSRVLSKTPAVFSNDLESIKPIVKLTREINSLQRIVKKITTSTMQKYYFQEVSTMFQFVNKSAGVKANAIGIQSAIEAGLEAKELIRKIIKNLKQESNWGSWEAFHSQKLKPYSIPPSYVDAAFEEMPVADAKMRIFQSTAEPFADNRDMQLNNRNLTGFADAFINNLLYDWISGAKVKTTLSKCNQIQASINAILHRLNTLKEQTENEISLIDVESSSRIERTEKFVQQKLEEKI